MKVIDLADEMIGVALAAQWTRIVVYGQREIEVVEGEHLIHSTLLEAF